MDSYRPSAVEIECVPPSVCTSKLIEFSIQYGQKIYLLLSRPASRNNFGINGAGTERSTPIVKPRKNSSFKISRRKLILLNKKYEFDQLRLAARMF